MQNHDQIIVPASEALERLQEGNQRFVDGNFQTSLAESRDKARQAAGQTPFAVVLGCSDSRVPVELIFDQGFGDLFVIRVAGNVVAASQIGSIEFAAEQFGVRLVVVLGHQDCGAVQATLDVLRSPGQQPSRNLRSIVDRIRPAVETLMETELAEKPEALQRAAIRSNVRVSSSQLRYGSEILENLIANDGLKIVGAEYCIADGKVEFFEGT